MLKRIVCRATAEFPQALAAAEAAAQDGKR